MVLRVVFMGTPEFAVPSLQALISSEHKVIAVYSQPPRPAGRGHKERPSPVHALAASQHIPVYTPTSLRDDAEQVRFASLGADIAVVAAYGLLLPRPVLKAYPLGCINVHPSALPRWRGAAPIQRTLMAGDTRTSCCIMQMDEGLDTGDILLEKPFPLPADITAGELHDEMAALGAGMVLDALKGLEEETLMPRAQPMESGATYAKKIAKEEARIDWSRPVQEVYNHIRGLSPYPGATTAFGEETLKILRADISTGTHARAPGTVTDDALTIACPGGYIRPTIVQRAGKAAMETEALLRGFAIPAGSVLS